MEIEKLIERYVNELKGKGALKSQAVERAFRRVERHLLLEWLYLEDDEGEFEYAGRRFTRRAFDPQSPELTPDLLKLIYSDEALLTRLDPPSSTSQPALVAHMLELLELELGMKVLEIGAGTGYNAALMQEIVGEEGRITTIDIQEDVVRQTRRLLKAAGYDRIEVIAGDGARGHPEGAPYDRIVATVGCPDISWAWAEQLSAGGFMLIPLQHGGVYCDPLVKLKKVSNYHLRGRVVGWSGFMTIRGELSARCVWEALEAERDDPPDRQFPTFPAFKEASGAWLDFHYFLALCDLKTYMGSNSFGIFDSKSEGLVAVTPEGIRLWGDEALYEGLKRIYSRWEQLGRPKLTDWHVELFPIEKAPEAPPDREVWEIERFSSRQLAWLA